MLWEPIAYIGVLVGIVGFSVCVVLAVRLDRYEREARAYLASREPVLPWREDIG